MSASSNTRSPYGRLVAWLATPSGLGAMFVVGLAVRLVLARGGGFPYDMASFAGWAQRLAERGPWNFYPSGGEDFFVDYPPGYLYVLWLLGMPAKAITGGAPPVFWLKLPPILADLALAGLVMVAAQRLAPSVVSRRMPVRPLAAAAILFNPAIIFVSAVWGQADSVPAVLVVGAFLLLGTGPPSLRREAVGIALLAFAVGTKPQAGFVLPIVALVLIWRHVRGGLESADDPRARRRAAWLGASRIAIVGAAGVIAGFLLFAPFQLYPARALDFYANSAGQYPVTSVFAFNLWGAVGVWRPDIGAEAVRFLGLPAAFWGVALFVAAGALVCAKAWASLRNGQDEGRVLVFGSMALTLVGFAVVTRIHERYLFLPLALGAMLIAARWLRIAFAGLSALYLINVFFPYVYYLDFEKRPAPKLWGLFDAFYGTALDGIRLRTISAFTAAVCLVVAWRGWQRLEMRATSGALAPEPPEQLRPPVAQEEAPPRAPWSLHFHPVGRRGALIALAVFAVALLSRIAGLGHPPGMYFDEVYHARTGAEYIGGKEVFEYTHPPFAKEVMGLSTRYLSGFGTTQGGALGSGVAARSIAPRADGVAWAHNSEGSTRVQLGRVSGSCELEPTETLARVDLRGDAIVATRAAVLLAGVGPDGPALVRFEGRAESWRATLPARASAISRAGERTYVVTERGDLVTVSEDGDQQTVAIGATAMSPPGNDDDNDVWVAFSKQRRIASWDAHGTRKDVISLDAEPVAIAEATDADRVFVSVGDEILSYDSESQTLHSRIPGAAQLLGAVPETTQLWASDGRQLRAIEPHSGVVIGRTSFDRTPDVLTAERTRHRLVGIAAGRTECAHGRPQFAWRLWSAVTGAAMVALVFLLALRLTGNLLVGLLAALFIAVDGLAFTLSRIAMNDSYATAGLLAAWLCVVSALWCWGRRGPDDPETPDEKAAVATDETGAVAPGARLRTIAWLAAAGVFGGLGLASKWTALYALAGVGLLLAWDGLSHGGRSVWGIAGRFVPSALIVAGCVIVLPLAVYVLSYIPYFALGHGFADFARLQVSMYEYHSTLTATHPFGSPWYGWPVGYRAVFLYLAGAGAERSEIWTVPNVVVLIGGLVAMGVLVRRAASARSATLLLVVLAAALQYLPWVAVSRVAFMYHYLAVVPFLAIALAWLLVVGLRKNAYQRPVTIAVSAAAVAVFLLVYPMLVGWRMPVSYLEGVRDVLPWVIP